ncbi:transposase [Fusarium oxysporum f. sp. phaseoli]
MPQLPYTEDDVIEAMLDVTDNGLSQHEAAQKHGMPQTTLSDRLRGIPPKSEVTHPSRLLSKSQEARLITWILRQEALGYAPSHSQVRATVAALLRQQGRERPIGVHWLTRFVKRHPSIKNKIGKRQEASRFNCFTPTAVNWYFDIREREYGWIKPENTVNVDEGGIMAGFGLDSLVIGSSDPKRKAFLKGSQSRTWTSFIEAVTATGRLLKPGIIFKGKELQQQWFTEELKEVADWYYITSDNGWTDNHIAIEWLREVYLPQTQPEDESDARLIILDGHRSHVSDEWMATCFLNNVYCCYLPAHCSHGLQPLDNGVFNVSKAAYRKELQKLTSLTDSAPVDKVNFIKAYAKAREVGMTKKNILSGWRVTGNWPISRRKALMHPEIQSDKKETTPTSDGPSDGQRDSDNTPKTSRHIRDLGKNKSPSTRRRYSVISRGFEAQESKIASLSSRVASLEEEVGRLSRGKKRKAIPNPNRKFMTLAEALVVGNNISEPGQAAEEIEAVEDVIEVGGVEEDEGSNSEAEELLVVRTRAGRAVKRPREY